MSATDIAWFLAELAAYAALVAWGLTRPTRRAVRWTAAVAAPLAFGVAWGVFAAPHADAPLTGGAAVAFRCAWLAVAAAAGANALRRRHAATVA